ncbi:MAG: RNA polymerase sigma factor [Bacillota bacterium]|nr:RNA polymerase sigma factor [Bacillota bacterium]
MLRFFHNHGVEAHRAEELAQEALARALAVLGSERAPRNLAPWLYRVASNLLRDEWRSAYRRKETPVDTVPPVPGDVETDPEAVLLDRERRARRRRAVRAALAGLPPDLLEVVVLRFYRGWPVRAIAEQLGLPEGTVKSRLYRAYRRLESDLEPLRGDER